MNKQSYTIKRCWFSSLPPITVEIECAATTPEGVKLGLAVRAAIGQKANLSGADLSRANLSGTNLSGANLTWAEIHGDALARCFARIDRDDGYTFLAMELEAGGVKIAAGCRWFSLAEFRAHVASEYPDTDKAKETLWIIDSIERRAADLGIALEPEKVAA